MTRSHREDRRNFLRRVQAIVAGGAAYALMPQLELVGRAMAAEPLPGNDYRALVCIFLFGGSDSFNMLVPYDSGEHQTYLTSRGGVYDATTNPFGLGYSLDQLVPVTDTQGKTWGLNPGCAAMKPLFDAGELAFLANIGPLVEPLTKDDVTRRLKRLPPYLYSHNDQQKLWMRGHTNRNGTTGWGGLLADRMEASNTGALSALPPSISIAGSNLFQFGQTTLPFAMSSGGPAAINRFRNDGSNADRIRAESLRALVEASYQPILQDQYAVIGDSAINLNDSLRVALNPANGGDIVTQFPAGGLASQLRMVARMIKASRTASIGHRRQIYYCSLGGFDTHQNQMAANGHAALLKQLADSLAAFRAALAEIGALNDTTAFTMSDFGRTLNSNGNGTDHGWGGVQLVMGGAAANGGALRGGQVWGSYPLLELDGAQAVGRGRMVPTISVNQMGATLAQWFGLPAGEVGAIFPGIENFAQPRLGFLG
ncbi:DUF1501 domain-containing protein [Lysobacter panacisoli]|uniref:DUF1501 domain-containing protein n=1 Tax=Lysobacter panacisoli TaxID=1255263 RepID=A0ABP9L5H7_9GAMM|nr:DUF1501 domain-containing protein [Lysobacter panacisoli]